MTRTLLVLCTLAVAACTESDHKVKDLSACHWEALKVYLQWRNDIGAAGDLGDFTYRCMKAKGYEYADACNPTKTGGDRWINETSEHCYRKAEAN